MPSPSSPGIPVTTLPCHPGLPSRRRGHRAVCPECGSFWDLESLAAPATYTDAYPRDRLHFDPRIGALKVRSLGRWLATTGLDPTGRVVCEVGFGGGHCLADLRGKAGTVFGIEAIPACLSHAVSLGVPEAGLFLFEGRPALLPEPVSLWVFQDSIEHIPELETFLPWVSENSAAGAALLVVAPNAASLSRRVLGRYWPHRVRDHLFHWSPAGLAAILGRHGFAPRRAFDPTKRVSTEMVFRHLAQTRRTRFLGRLAGVVPRLEVWFNMGEMGLLFERDRSRA
jgi:hypothetical protein